MTMSEEKDMIDNTPVNHDVVYPAVTIDYRVAKVKVGWGIVANRKIKKGEQIMTDSFDYLFGDVQEGDRLLLTNRRGKDLPTHLPLTREILLQTHGVPVINPDLSTDDEVVVSWYLEVPGMLMNHSCDPNMAIDSDDEDVAARDIEVGEELTVDYCYQFYDRGPFFDKCRCGMAKCRGSMMGFKALSDEQQEEMLPRISEAVNAMYLADIGKGPRVREELTRLPPRIHMPFPTLQTGELVTPLRIVFPGPSVGLANVSVKKYNGNEGDEGKYALYASKDVSRGEMFYEFWWEEWPQGGKAVIDMVFASHLHEEDPPEGTVIRFDPRKSGAYRTAGGDLMFSGWQLLTEHSCDPNVVYRNKEKYEKNSWQSVFAAKDIKKGDLITMDWNCFIWDRSEIGTKQQGCKYLSPQAQHELKAMSWLHEMDPENDTPNTEALARALSPYVRASLLDAEVVCCIEDKDLGDVDETSTSSSSFTDT